MNQEIIKLYNEYTHSTMPRTEFLKKLAIVAGGTLATSTVLPLLELNKANAATMPLNDDELFTERISYLGNNCTMQAYVARPIKNGKYATVLVIHENRGLNAHIEDVARRCAKAGFLAIAPNALAALPTLPATEDEARTAFAQLNADQTLDNFKLSVDYAANRKDSNSKIGCVGFCWGGAMANNLAIQVASLKAAVAFYGRQPNTTDVSKIKAAIQLHYAGLDERVNAGIAGYETALKANNINYQLFMYEGVNHAFHNDTSVARYNKEAATLAWQRTIDFFKQHLQ